MYIDGFPEYLDNPCDMSEVKGRYTHTTLIKHFSYTGDTHRTQKDQNGAQWDPKIDLKKRPKNRSPEKILIDRTS